MNVNPLEKYDFGYFDLNPDYDSSIKIINKKTVIQGNGAAYYFGEIQVYDELDCFGDLQVISGENVLQYLSGTLSDTNIYGPVEILDTTNVDGVLEII